MAVCYFDSSAYVKLLVDEVGSDIAARLWDEADVVVASRLAHPEVLSALAADGRANRLDPQSLRQARGDWPGFWESTRIIELTEPITGVAGDLTTTLVLGGADAVHLASALTLAEVGPLLTTWDQRLRKAAVEAGLVVVPAELQE